LYYSAASTDWYYWPKTVLTKVLDEGPNEFVADKGFIGFEARKCWGAVRALEAARVMKV
jgi:hypothetical protein